MVEAGVIPGVLLDYFEVGRECAGVVEGLRGVDGGVDTFGKYDVNLASDEIDCQFLLYFQVIQHHLPLFDQDVCLPDRVPLQDHVTSVALHSQALYLDAIFAPCLDLLLVNLFLESIVLLKRFSRLA